MGKRVTIQMIADYAGVSRGTVDRVLNERSYVKEDVRQRVQAAIRELGYVPPRSRSSEMSQPLTLGVLLPNWENQFREETDRGIRMAQDQMEDAGVRILVRRCRTDLPQETLALLDELVEQGAEGLSVCAPNDLSVEQRIDALVEQGIPCVTFNSDLPGSRRLCFVGQDIYRSGRVAAELMSKCVPAGSTVLATVGNRKFDGHRLRLNGFLDRMKELGFSPEQLWVEDTFNDYRTTVRVVSTALERCPDLAGVYMANLSVSGCTEAIRLAGRRGQTWVVCHDINESIRQLLRDGAVDFTIPQDMVQQAYLPLALLRDLLRKGKHPDLNHFKDQIQILCAENLNV